MKFEVNGFTATWVPGTRKVTWTQGRSDVYTLTDLVRDGEGRIIAAKRLAQAPQ